MQGVSRMIRGLSSSLHDATLYNDEQGARNGLHRPSEMKLSLLMATFQYAGEKFFSFVAGAAAKFLDQRFIHASDPDQQSGNTLQVLLIIQYGFYAFEEHQHLHLGVGSGRHRAV